MKQRENMYDLENSDNNIGDNTMSINSLHLIYWRKTTGRVMELLQRVDGCITGETLI